MYVVRCSCRTPTVVDVAKAYKGDSSQNFHSYSVQMVFIMSKTAIILDMTGIEAIVEIMNEEEPEGAIEKKRLRCCDASRAVQKNDCPVLRKFVSFYSLCPCPSLFNEKNTAIQIDIVYSLRDVCKPNDYRHPLKDITPQYDLCVNAHEESKRFTDFTGSDWLEEFNLIEGDLLKTTMLDDELMGNRENAKIIPPLLETFQKRRRQVYAQRIPLFRASRETKDDIHSETSRYK